MKHSPHKISIVMLLNTLSNKELLSRISDVVAKFSFSTGLSQKYEKQLKNRKVLDGAILGVHKYNILDNTVYVVAQKRTYNLSSRKAGEMVFTYYISVLNPKTGKYSYVMPTFGMSGYEITGYVMFTAHFIQRLNERDGKEFVDLLREVGGDAMALVDQNDEGGVETTWGTYRLFGKQEGPFVYIATMVTDDMLYENQLPTGEEIERRTKEYNIEKCQYVTGKYSLSA